MDDKAEKIALFRYGLIAPLVLETLPRGELTRRAQEIASRLYGIPHSTRRQVSVDTLLEWTLRYRRNGLAALTPQLRKDRGQQRVIAPETAALIERLKRENPHRTGTMLLRDLPEDSLSASTLYRFLRANGLTERQLLLDKAAANTHKKYEAQFSNQIWQSDMLFGPWVKRDTGGGKMQVFRKLSSTTPAASFRTRSFIPTRDSIRFLAAFHATNHVREDDRRFRSSATNARSTVRSKATQPCRARPETVRARNGKTARSCRGLPADTVACE